MMRTEAQRRKASAERFRHSQSLASRLHRLSQPIVRSTTACTILPVWGAAASGTGRRGSAAAWRWDAEHHFDVVAINLDPPHQRSYDVPCAEPVEGIKPSAHLGGEVLQLTGDRDKLPLGVCRLGRVLLPLLKLGHTRLEPGNARLEL